MLVPALTLPFATLAIGLDILNEEHVTLDTLLGHGGLFKTPGVAQRYLAAAAHTAVTCTETAGEGGPYGMALLAAHMFFVQDIQPDGQRGKRGVNVGAHQVCQAEITFRPTQQHGAACIKVGHALMPLMKPGLPHS